MKYWLVAGLVFLITATIVVAQTSNDLFNRSANSGASYRNAHTAYIQAKNQHQQYNTGATRAEAISRTNQLLAARNQWQIDYLKFLRSTLAEVTNIANYGQTVVYLDMEGVIQSLENQTDLDKGTTFEQINARSRSWEEQLITIDRLALAARIQIASARLTDFQNQLEGYVADFNSSQATPSANQTVTLNLVATKLDQSAALRQQIETQLTSYKSLSTTSSNLTNMLNQSRTLLVEAAQLVDELYRRP